MEDKVVFLGCEVAALDMDKRVFICGVHIVKPDIFILHKLMDDEKSLVAPLSPGAEKRLVHSIEVEDKRLAVELRREELIADNVYKSCCLVIDRRAVLFFTQLAMSVATLVFSCWMLIRGEYLPCESSQLYVGLLTLILGWWAPAPSLH